MSVRLKSERDLEKLRQSGQILSLIFKKIRNEAKTGTSLKFFDDLARKLLKENGAEPAFLNYRPGGARKPFPAAICASLNDQVVHGVPDARVLKNGDILKIKADMPDMKFKNI